MLLLSVLWHDLLSQADMSKVRDLDGQWRQTDSKAHWLNYATILQPDDADGNDHMQLQAEIRSKISEAAAILEQHNIKIFNIYTMKDHDPRTWDTAHRIAIGFEYKEDLMLAKLVLKCNV